MEQMALLSQILSKAIKSNVNGASSGVAILPVNTGNIAVKEGDYLSIGGDGKVYPSNIDIDGSAILTMSASGYEDAYVGNRPCRIDEDTFINYRYVSTSSLLMEVHKYDSATKLWAVTQGLDLGNNYNSSSYGSIKKVRDNLIAVFYPSSDSTDPTHAYFKLIEWDTATKELGNIFTDISLEGSGYNYLSGIAQIDENRVMVMYYDAPITKYHTFEINENGDGIVTSSIGNTAPSAMSYYTGFFGDFLSNACYGVHTTTLTKITAQNSTGCGLNFEHFTINPETMPIEELYRSLESWASEYQRDSVCHTDEELLFMPYRRNATIDIYDTPYFIKVSQDGETLKYDVYQPETKEGLELHEMLKIVKGGNNLYYLYSNQEPDLHKLYRVELDDEKLEYRVTHLAYEPLFGVEGWSNNVSSYLTIATNGDLVGSFRNSANKMETIVIEGGRDYKKNIPLKLIATVDTAANTATTGLCYGNSFEAPLEVGGKRYLDRFYVTDTKIAVEREGENKW